MMMRVIKRVYREIRAFSRLLGANSVGAYSASAAFFAVTSFFPFMLLLMTFVQNTPLERSIAEALDNNVVNTIAGEFLGSVITEISESDKPNLLFGTVAGLSVLWTASRFMLSVVQGLNKICRSGNAEKTKKKGWVKLRVMSLLYLALLQIVLLAALGILVFGELINGWLAEEFGIYVVSEVVIASRWAVGFLLLIAVFTLSYTFVPERKTRLRSQLPGATLAAIGWLGFSWLFAVYVDGFANYGAVYGSLAAVVVLMLWLYFCMYILFMGAAVADFVRQRFLKTV
jgi:membrane protein